MQAQLLAQMKQEIELLISFFLLSVRAALSIRLPRAREQHSEKGLGEGTRKSDSRNGLGKPLLKNRAGNLLWPNAGAPPPLAAAASRLAVRLGAASAGEAMQPIQCRAARSSAKPWNIFGWAGSEQEQREGAAGREGCLALRSRKANRPGRPSAAAGTRLPGADYWPGMGQFLSWHGPVLVPANGFSICGAKYE